MNIKQTIRAWLGFDSLPSVEMYKAMERKQRERHEEILRLLNAIEKRVTNARPVQAPQEGIRFVDWEQVQAMALEQIERENAQDKSKEN